MSQKTQVPSHPIKLSIVLTMVLIALIAEFFVFKTTAAFIGLILIPVLPFALYVVWSTPKHNKLKPSTQTSTHNDDTI
jgi:hypothetical protein